MQSRWSESFFVETGNGRKTPDERKPRRIDFNGHELVTDNGLQAG